jgi:hypothetical protein
VLALPPDEDDWSYRLCHDIWQITLIALLAAVATVAFVRSRIRARWVYALLFLGLLAVLVLLGFVLPD